MLQGRRVGAIVGMGIVLIACSRVTKAEDLTDHLPLLKSSRDLPAFGPNHENTTISAASFVPDRSTVAYFTSGSLGRATPINTHAHYYATLNIPSGAVIDFLGLNSTTDADGVVGLTLWRRFGTGFVIFNGGFSAPAHVWRTDFAGPLNLLIDSHDNEVFILDVESAASPTLEFFGFVQIVWHRTVSSAPSTATFGDVPTSSPQFKFVEALHAAGITAGCGGGNFCPDAPVTRGQMAVFLATALGLQWSN